MKNIFKTLALLVIISLIYTNTTQAQHSKKTSKNNTPKKSGFVKNQYQDLTTHFNRYFNANLKYTEGTTKLSTSHKDKFEDILPVYAFKGKDGEAISSEIDAIIKKTSIAVQLKPNSKWVDDCYLLLGKAYYLKGDYESATQSFQYIRNKFGKSIRSSYDSKSKEKQQEHREKEKEKKELAKNKEKAEKEKIAKAEKEKAEKEKERKKAAKEKENKKKEKEKAAKAEKEKAEKEKAAKEKERKEAAKEKEKEREQLKKEKEKERKAREKAKKQGKPYTPPKKEEKNTNTKNTKKEDKPTTPNTQTPTKNQKQDTAKENNEETTENINDIFSEEAVETGKTNNKKNSKQNNKKDKKTDEEAFTREAVINTANGKERIYKPGGLFRHRPAKYEAGIWLARTLVETNKLSDAEQIINNLQNDATFPKQMAGDLNTVSAYYFLAKNDNENAKNTLETALKHTRKRTEKARLHYILAQLNQQQTNYANALKNYKKVLKSQPPYDMYLQAQINIAKTKIQSNQYTTDQATKYLEKLAKDPKNADKQDIILLALSDIATLSGNTEKAAEYLTKSTANAKKGSEQKSNAFLKLAEMKYNQEQYLEAAPYYDSTAISITKTNDKYAQVIERRSYLNELSIHAKNIALQDSLLKIANKPETERNQWIDALIEKTKKEAEAKKLAEENAQEALLDNLNNPITPANAGQWYFDNPIARSNGFDEFRFKWGERPLSDNWRLSSKSNIADTPLNNDSIPKTQNDLKKLAEQGSLTREVILKSLPLSPKAKQQADSLCIESMYTLGRIYKEKIKNDKKAIETFENLLKKYPKNKYEAHTHYNLYLIAEKTKNTPQQNFHQKQIINNYPESVFAKILQNPEYLKILNGEGGELVLFYEETYALYKNQEFKTVLERKTQASSKFNPNPLQPKFDLLAAFAIAKTENKEAYVAALNNIVTKYPNNEVQKKAQEILQYLNTQTTKNNTQTTKNNAEYKYEPNTPHYFVIAFDTYSEKIAQLTANLNNFNSVNYSVDKLKVNQMLLDANHQLILIKDFPNSDKASLYMQAIQNNESTVFNGSDASYQLFIASKNNFTQLFKDHNIENYLQFFMENYK